MILQVKHELDTGTFSDTDWIYEDGNGKVYLHSGTKPKYGKIKKLGAEYWEGDSDNFAELIPLYKFFSKRGVEPKDSIMRISEFKTAYCVV